MLELRILGPLEVLVEGAAVDLRRQKQRALLGLLLLRAGEVVSVDTLIEELWTGKPPPTAKDALQNYVSQLRKSLGKEVILTRSPGYVLEIEPAQTDVGRFQQLVGGARGQSDAEARAVDLRAALALWRGPALADLAYEGFAAAEAARLEELRAVVHEDLVDAELELGRHAELVPELEELVARHPYDERARAQLMLALYRAGRQADALEAFKDARRILDEELGLEPSPTLRELERSILMQEPSLVTEPETAAGERRKTVTVLSAGLTPVEGADPERLRATIVRGVAAARAAIERHEGWVTARAGDELLGVFGVPAAHEDDALRAARAAVELRDAVGDALELRVGIDTGEALTGHGFVSGDVLRVAGHLQRTASSGQIVVGDGALELVLHGVDGKRAKTGFLLADVKHGAPVVASPADVPLVGRERELEELLRAFGKAVQAGTPRLVALIGDPGIGKSRLVRELAAQLADEATVLVGRCVAYGEGAMYAPLREIVSGVDLDAAVTGEDEGELIARRVTELVGLAEGAVSMDEGFWAMRRVLSALAADLPLVLAFEDFHWAGPQLLDFADQVLERADGPMLLLCTGRQELLDERDGWREHAIVLEPLSAEETLELAGDSRIVDIAEGNPLFAQQLSAYAEERGEVALKTVPPSLEALLASRLDLLDPDVRGTAQRAALIGRELSREGLAALSTPEATPALSAHLLELVRRGLVHPARAADQESYRFHHALVRDVAYAGLPKAERADLHEAFGDWLAAQSEAADEVVGYHLEQAYTHRAEVVGIDRRAKQLAADAGKRLGNAGMRAWRQTDVPTTIDLLGRATSLLPDDDPWRRELLCELGVACDASGSARLGQEVLLGALAAAEAARDARCQQRARVELALVAKADDLLDVTAQAVPLFEAVGDDRSLGRAYLAAGWVQGGRLCQNQAWEEAADRALVHYRRAGFPVATCLGQIAGALYYGPVRVGRAIDRCLELLEEATDRTGRARVLGFFAGLEAMRGEFDEARDLLDEGQAVFEELGQAAAAGTYCTAVRADVELLAGDISAASSHLEELCGQLREHENWGALATSAADLANVLVDLNVLDDAKHWAAVARDHAAADDLGAQFASRAAKARLLAHDGEHAVAEKLAREAVALAEPTDALNKRAAVLLSMAEVLRLSGKAEEADAAVARGSELFMLKDNAAALARLE